MPILIAAVVVGVGAVGVLTGFIWEPIKLVAEAMANVANAVVDLLPEAADLGLDGGEGWLMGYVMLNTFLPLSEALAFGALFVVVVGAGFVFRLAVTIYHLIPKPGMGT